MTLLILSAQFVLYLAHAAAIVAYPFDIDQGEGYDVNAGWLLAQGRPIYTNNENFPYFSSNYPPFYAVIVAAAIGIWGPTVQAGRVVSVAATLGLAWLIFLAASRRSNGAGGFVAVGAFWLSNYVFHVTPLARVNALTTFLALAGLLCIARARSGWVTLGAALLLLAVYTKPTAIDAVAAALTFLFFEQRRLALMVGATLGVCGLLIALVLEQMTEGSFSLNVLFGNVNPFSPAQLREYLLNFWLLHGVPLALAVYSTTRSFRVGRLDVIQLFFLSGLLMTLGVGKWGAGESYFLSAIVASCILAGGVAGRLVVQRGAAAVLVSLLFIGQSAVSAHGAVSAWLPVLYDRGLQAAALAPEPTHADLERGHSIVTRLRTMPGTGLVEDPGFELAAGKEVVGNATHLRNLHQSGLWRGDKLLADLADRRYHTVVLDAELYPEPVLAAIGRYYFLYDVVTVHGAEQRVFVPGAS